jgi:methionyl-tRNA formyltransferase
MLDRIAILTSDEPHHDYMIATMRTNFHVVLVIKEPGSRMRVRARREKRWPDYVFMNYHNWRRTLLGLNSYRSKYFSDIPAAPEQRVCPEITVDYINDPEVADMLIEARPDLTIIMAPSILKRQVLQAAGTIINVHGGFLPYYRGNHCFFFALYNQEFDKIGSTIHFVNAGIDTGDIIDIVVPPIKVTDNAERLYCRAEKMAVHKLVDLIRSAQQGGVFPRQAQLFRGRLYKTRDRKPWHDLHHWLRCVTGVHSRALTAWKAGVEK